MEITFPTRACVQRGLCENTVGESGHVRVSRHGQSRLGCVQKHGQSSRTIVNCYERELQWSKEHRIQERRAKRGFSRMYTLNMNLPSSSLTLDWRQSLRCTQDSVHLWQHTHAEVHNFLVSHETHWGFRNKTKQTKLAGLRNSNPAVLGK